MTNKYILSSIAFLILLMACANFINLSTARALKRAREIGIRIVPGASARRIPAEYAGSFLKLVLIANVLSVPLIWYAMSIWLERFANRIHLQWTAFAIVLLISVPVAFITISIQVYRASRANPVEALRAE